MRRTVLAAFLLAPFANRGTQRTDLPCVLGLSEATIAAANAQACTHPISSSML